MCLCFPGLKTHFLTQQGLTPDSRDNNHNIQLDLPVIERPDLHSPSYIVSLGPLMFNEATEVGNAEILEHIHEAQFGLSPDEEQFKDNLFLHFGDAMTTSRIHSLKHNRSVCESAYGKLDWVLVMFGLWHLRLNMQRLIMKHHFGDENDDHASLWYAWHSAFTSRKFNDKVFEQCDQLITQSFYARLIAVMRHVVASQISATDSRFDTAIELSVTDSGPGPEREPIKSHHYREHVEEWFQTQPQEVIAAIITQIYNTIDIHSIRSDGLVESLRQLGITGLPAQTSTPKDYEFTNHLHFLANAFPYMLITDAIKVSDIGLLRHVSREALLLFAGSTENYLYTRELCYFYWITSTPAADTELQRILLLESLVNKQGKPDTYYEMDKANELLNLHLRIVKLSRRSSSIQVDQLMERYTRLYVYQDQLRERFEKALGVSINNKHKKKSLDDQLWLMASNLLQAIPGQVPSIIEDVQGRTSGRLTPLLAELGKARLSKVVTDFNRWRKNADIGDVDNEGNQIKDTVIQGAALFQQQLLARYQTEKAYSKDGNAGIIPLTQSNEENILVPISPGIETQHDDYEVDIDFDIGDDESIVLTRPVLRDQLLSVNKSTTTDSMDEEILLEHWFTDEDEDDPLLNQQEIDRDQDESTTDEDTDTDNAASSSSPVTTAGYDSTINR